MTMLVRARGDAGTAAAPASPVSRARGGPGLAGAFAVVVLAQLVIAPYSWVAIKGVVALTGALALIRLRGALSSPLAPFALAWCAAAVVAAAFGVDPWQSLIGRSGQGNGLLLIVACAACLLGGSVLPAAAVSKVPAWLVATGTGVACVTLAVMMFPGSVGSLGIRIGFQGVGTPPLGHPVYAAALLACALVAAVHLSVRRPLLAMVSATVIATGLAATGKRGALLGALVGIALAAVRGRGSMRVGLRIGAILVSVVAAWTLLGLGAGPIADGSRVGTIVDGSSMARPYTWMTSARSVAERPLTGWGPANTWGANLSTQSYEEALMTGRYWQDAHNLIVESAVTTGLLGALALIALMIAALRLAARGAPERAWAAGVAAALLLHHALQPVHVSLTPLFFLLLGIAAATRRAPGPDTTSRHPAAGRGSRVVRGVLVSVLALGIGLDALAATAATFEGYARRYYTPDHPALRAALALQPRRALARAALAQQLALDAGEDPRAQAAARAHAARIVRDHQWEPPSRITAARVELILGAPDRAAMWLDEHLGIFPHDPLAMVLRANAAHRMGDGVRARSWLLRARALDPNAGRYVPNA